VGDAWRVVVMMLSVTCPGPSQQLCLGLCQSRAAACLHCLTVVPACLPTCLPACLLVCTPDAVPGVGWGCLSPQVFGVPSVSARFGTAPEPWNWGMVAMARLAPKSERASAAACPLHHCCHGCFGGSCGCSCVAG
jgi:hypothetical protein